MVNFAQYGLLVILNLLLVLHICILLKIIPYRIIWGGRLKTDTEMYRFEAVSILINLIFLFVILVQSQVLTIDIPKQVMTFLFWTMTTLFLFNTLGNVISKNALEQRLFAPITIILTMLSLILALTN